MSTESRFQIDHAFLESVELEIGAALAKAAELEAGFNQIAIEPKTDWLSAMDQLTANLSNWQGRLAALTERTAAAEAELTEQENGLRTWMQLMNATSTKLWQFSAAQSA